MASLCSSAADFSRPSTAQAQARKYEGGGVALALGGGFSRAFAHLGVLEVLEQEQIPISAIVGTSMGSLLGAAYSDGISVRDLCEMGRRVRIRDFVCVRRPGQDGKRIDLFGHFMQEWFRAVMIEDLPIPTAIVATDLEAGAPLVFVRGPLEVAIRASCAFPGLFKPVEFEGRRLADGCIVAPVPTALAAQMNSNCVLGVAVGSNAIVGPSTENVVKVFDRAYRSSHRTGLEPSWSRHADVLLEPEVHDIDWNDFTRVDEAFAAGAEVMRRALPSVREMLDRREPVACGNGIRAGAERWLVL